MYWHILTKKEKRKILKSHIKMGDFLKQYKQPSWCGYPKALASIMGCWSLMMSLKNVSKQFCKDCDCYVYPAHGNAKRKGSFRDYMRENK